MTESNRITKQVTIKAPRSRVWRAITDTREFGQWFGVELEGPFVAGKAIGGQFRMQLDEVAIANYQRKLGLVPSGIKVPEKMLTFCTVDRIEPEHYFSFHWIPFGIDAEVDPVNEPTTLVEFTLEEVAEGTLLTIEESGFDKVPVQRRQRAFMMNDGGWAAQAQNVKRHVESN